MQEEIIVVDNFLIKDEFNMLSELFTGCNFPWYLSNGKAHVNDGHWQFVHNFYSDNSSHSKYINNLNFIDNIAKCLIRVKANLTVRTKSHEKSQFHTDIGYLNNNGYKTSVLYINTNNGYTEFENGKKVKSVANRLVTFNGNIKHRGVTHTSDEHHRIVLNLNYF